jgi:microcystin degradation protein MlrC
VERLTDGRYRIEGRDHFAALYGREVHMGRCAVVRSGGVRVLLNERKTPPGDLAQLRSQGLTPEAQRIIVAKSAVAFRGSYGPIAAEIYAVDTPGLCSADLSRFPYRKLARPIYPLDDMG